MQRRISLLEIFQQTCLVVRVVIVGCLVAVASKSRLAGEGGERRAVVGEVTAAGVAEGSIVQGKVVSGGSHR